MEPSEPTLAESAVDEKADTLPAAEPNSNADTNEEFNEPRGVKRSAEDDLVDNTGENDASRDTDTARPIGASSENPPMSKSQMKKLKRQRLWEEGREDRRLKRIDKRHERQARRRAEKEEEITAAKAEGREPVIPGDRRRHRSMKGSKVPIGIIIDCQFEKYMTNAELISLSSQVTRCYSDNRGAQHPVHFYISSYGGYLKERNETILKNHHLKWKGIRFCEGDFAEAAKDAKECMAGPQGGQLIDLLQQSSTGETKASVESAAPKPTPVPEPEAEDVNKSIVYLTADSPHTLDHLEPNTCYVIGGIIDKNREKGLCYQIARDKKVRTAKLPISEYMVLQHRHVLATNHVLEIMLKWLETGDWGKAFMEIIPKRREGKLKTNEDTPTETPEAEVIEESGDLNNYEAEAEQDNTAQLDAPESSTSKNGNDVMEVEGDNAEEGLAKNALDEPRWSAPPLELEPTAEEKGKPADIASS
ncbi:tRNA-methyltransferase-domain-containing protein [Xylaria bambusicola]|uniref:tRNA-methyltransferase-domain-containing protein n=1 Tax=Xylaria bambusicola TaxID=326684 RepID=UPI0020080B60|nr:tRNA-methyltransferase-domain-containing protein [Xylaria bambusicola]KAI0514656.1 tRNA-methyltransferase-domain-containing protein [Xylaria bambusicola]